MDGYYLDRAEIVAEQVAAHGMGTTNAQLVEELGWERREITGKLQALHKAHEIAYLGRPDKLWRLTVKGGEQLRRRRLLRFIAESNRIEGIMHSPTPAEIDAHEKLFGLSYMVRVADLENFVMAVAGKPLRDSISMNVIVGQHTPPPGGPHIRDELTKLLKDLTSDIKGSKKPDPFEFHRRYETLHPFLDGNGRSGRALWAWHHLQVGAVNPFRLGFLHSFYYEALQHGRS